mmetsp:Transcript_65489/g.109879  ORF Transcript_65489/g.109879 Transcript_65489/m.109879 type:complete len:92 (+) Transcript_65489:841-1116(+)
MWREEQETPNSPAQTLCDAKLTKSHYSHPFVMVKPPCMDYCGLCPLVPREPQYQVKTVGHPWGPRVVKGARFLGSWDVKWDLASRTIGLVK